MERAFRMSVADVYPLNIQKVERKGRTKADVDEVTRWLTGFTQAELDAHLASGTTLRDFIGGDGQPGYFQQELFVYGRGGQPCKVCGTELREVKLGQRASVYCPRCQR